MKANSERDAENLKMIDKGREFARRFLPSDWRLLGVDPGYLFVADRSRSLDVPCDVLEFNLAKPEHADAIEAVGAGDVPRDRLIELAKEGAKRFHEEAWTHPSEANHGHAINLKANDLGFSDCSHRDCELVRLEAIINAAFAAMQKLMFPSAPPPPETT